MIDIKRIIQLLDEADDIVSALYRQGANKDYKCKSLREKLKAIYAEITTPPKSNGDRIRQMTDDELFGFLNEITDCCSLDKYCDNCPMKYPDGAYYRCNIEAWLKQEVIEDATD